MFNRSASDKIVRQAYQQAATGQLDDAIAVLRRNAQLADPKGDFAEAIGFIFFQHGRWQEAADAFAQSLKIVPDNMMRLHYQAQALARAGQWDDAMTRLTDAASQHPKDVSPPCVKCLLMGEKGDVAAARQAYDQARTILREHASEQSAYGMGLMEDCAELLAGLDHQAEGSK